MGSGVDEVVQLVKTNGRQTIRSTDNIIFLGSRLRGGPGLIGPSRSLEVRVVSLLGCGRVLQLFQNYSYSPRSGRGKFLIIHY